ncbi:MAG: glycosyltransferase [Actinomycetota bacterium]
MRILCATLPGPGHGHPMLALARALSQRGHEVTFASGDSHAIEAKENGLGFELLPRVHGSPLHDLKPYDDAASQALAMQPLLKELEPDAAVVDVITLGAALGVDLIGIPWATLVVHPLHTPSRVLPPFGYGRAPGRMPPLRLRDAWMRANNRKDLERARTNLNAGRARIGLAPVESLDVGLSERLVLVATLPALEIARPDWPSVAHLIGPCLWDYPGDAFEPPAGDGPLVLIAPSTAYDGDRMLDPALDAVRRLGVRAVVTPGAARLPEALPPGVSVVRGVSHSAIHPHVAAEICNGGHGTVVRALSAGVPLVVVPGHGDQQENAYRVERAGAGVQVRFPSSRSIRAGLARVLGRPSYKAGAELLAAEAAGINGPTRAAELIEETLASGKQRRAG